MKKLVAIFILLGAAGGGTWWYFNYGKPKEKPQVMQGAISRGDVTEVVTSTGKLEALRTVQVGSQVSGTVKELYADFNSIVKKDQKIAELDDSLLQVQVAIQEANVSRQEGDIAQAKVQLENDQLNLKRQQQMVEKGLINQQAYEQAQLTVKSRVASINSSEKGLLQTKANLDSAKLNVRYCTIYSPVDGVVVNRLVDKGQTVQSSVNVAQFFTIATDLTNLKLSAGVDEAAIGRIRSGMAVKFTVGSYGQQPFDGTVDVVRLNATDNQNVVTYPVWINVPNPDLKLRPSMTASIKIIVSMAPDTLRVPNSALRFKPNAEILTALNIPVPTAGQGRATRAADAAGAPGAPPAANAPAGAPVAGPPGAPPAAPGAPGSPGTPVAGVRPGMPGQPGQQAQGAPGGSNRNQGRQGQQGQQGRGGSGGRNSATPGRGFGMGAQTGMTPQQLAALANRTGGRGGNQGANQGGRGGRGNQQSANATGDTTPLTERGATKIDELFAPVVATITPGKVYTWDPTKTPPELKEIAVRLGVTDGTFTQLVSDNLQVGQQIVTSVIIPVVVKPGQQNANPFMGNQRGGAGGMGGMTPGAGGGGAGGGGAGGGGGGGGRGGGGGGGGRGGN